LTSLKTFLASESGATAIEYAMIASIICLAIFAVVGTIGSKLPTGFAKASNGFN